MNFSGLWCSLESAIGQSNKKSTMSLSQEYPESSEWQLESGMHRYVYNIRDPNSAAVELFYSQAMEHPNIVNVKEASVATGLKPPLSRSNLRKITLHDGPNYMLDIAKSDLPISAWKQLDGLYLSLWDLLCGVRALHSQGMAHMDLSPSSILVYPRGLDHRSAITGLQGMQDAKAIGRSDSEWYKSTDGLLNALRDLAAFSVLARFALAEMLAMNLSLLSEGMNLEKAIQVSDLLSRSQLQIEKFRKLYNDIVERKIDYNTALIGLMDIIRIEYHEAGGKKQLQCSAGQDLLVDEKNMSNHQFARLYSARPDFPALQGIWKEYCQGGERPDPECFYAELMSMRRMAQNPTVARGYEELASQYPDGSNSARWARWIVDFVTREPTEFPRAPDSEFFQVLKQFRLARKRKRQE